MKASIDCAAGQTTISRHIYGNFSEHLGRCIYGGIWVGEDSPIPNTRGIRNDVVAALKALKLPNLRWPGGCFADDYHWMDGIGPKEDRPTMVNIHWGGVTENNHFGTHEFLDLCEMIGCEPVICGNVGSGSVREMRDWVEYLNFDGVSPMADLRRKNGRNKPFGVKFFGVGNETWGCGGNMRPEYYADEYRRYQSYLRTWGGTQLFKIACGASDDNTAWTEVLMREAGCRMDGLSLHYYTIPGNWQKKGDAVDFTHDEWVSTLTAALRMDSILTNHSRVMDKYDQEKRVKLIVDEWGTWFDVEKGTHPGFLYQQSTMRDALVAGITLNIFQKHADRVGMANIAQTINVLQAVILTQDEKMVKTPTYHVFDLYKGHQDATMLPLTIQSQQMEEALPQVHASASRDAQGTVLITLCNTSDTQEAVISLSLHGLPQGAKATARMLTGVRNAHNTFDAPDTVQIVPLETVSLLGDTLTVTLPAVCVAAIQLG